jgi:CheY-like chemotaxis protein
MHLNILIAEDSEDEILLMRAAFKKAGVTEPFYAVQNGEEAVAYLKGEGIYADRRSYPFPDVMLLDLNMPRVNGFEVLEWLRQSPPAGRRLIVYVLTASCREADVRNAYELGANAVIIKPTQVAQLIEFVAALHTWHRFVGI